MKLAAIFNVWSDFDWLDISTKIVEPLVDGVIVVASTRSNYGEYCAIPERWLSRVIVHEPKFNIPMHSETDKRNHGLDLAKKTGYTHFISMDADEVYKPDEFIKIKNRFHVEPNLQGLVCPSIVYFGKINLSIGRDITLVPHIHRITPQIRHEFNRKYPHAWINGQIRIDPTRSLNINSGVDYTEEIEMHHYSHVRKDYQRKIRNSTARAALEKSQIVHDLETAKDGSYSQFYQKTVRTATFNLNELLDKNLLPMEAADQKGQPS